MSVFLSDNHLDSGCIRTHEHKPDFFPPFVCDSKGVMKRAVHERVDHEPNASEDRRSAADHVEEEIRSACIGTVLQPLHVMPLVVLSRSEYARIPRVGLARALMQRRHRSGSAIPGQKNVNLHVPREKERTLLDWFPLPLRDRAVPAAAKAHACHRRSQKLARLPSHRRSAGVLL